MDEAHSAGSLRELADAPLGDQIAALERIILSNPVASTILERAPQLALPQWSLGAGCVAQSVWNHLHGFDLARGIRDYDLIYFDADDLSAESERAVEDRARRIFSVPEKVDVTNEARVHVWYCEKFGRSIEPYRSIEDAVSTFPCTATSIAVRYDDGRFLVCAPFGLKDLFSLVVRPNRAIVSRTTYEEKAGRWLALWPRLAVVPWSDHTGDGPGRDRQSHVARWAPALPAWGFTRLTAFAALHILRIQKLSLT